MAHALVLQPRDLTAQACNRPLVFLADQLQRVARGLDHDNTFPGWVGTGLDCHPRLTTLLGIDGTSRQLLKRVSRQRQTDRRRRDAHALPADFRHGERAVRASVLPNFLTPELLMGSFRRAAGQAQDNRHDSDNC